MRDDDDGDDDGDGNDDDDGEMVKQMIYAYTDDTFSHRLTAHFHLRALTPSVVEHNITAPPS